MCILTTAQNVRQSIKQVLNICTYLALSSFLFTTITYAKNSKSPKSVAKTSAQNTKLSSAAIVTNTKKRIIPSPQTLSKRRNQPRLKAKPEVPVNIGRLSDTLVALFPGALVHGAGHWYRGDFKSSQRIIFLEGVSLLALLSAYSMEQSLDQDTAFNRSSTQWLYHIGGVLFVSTWFADVIGSFRGDQYYSKRKYQGINSRFSTGYRYQNDPQRSFNHHLIAQLDFDYRKWQFDLGLDWESNAKLAGLYGSIQHQSYSHLAQNSLHPSFVNLGVFTKRWVWLQEGLTQWLVSPFVYGGLSLDLLSRGLKSFTLFHKFSIAWEQYILSPIASLPNSEATIRAFPLILDSGLIYSFHDDFSLSVSIMQDSTQDIRPLNENHVFWRSEMKVRQSEKLDLKADFMLGEDWSMWITLSFKLGKKT